jgi:hypothetical protein
VLLSEARLEGGTCEALVKSLTRLYKLLVVAAKAQLAPRGELYCLALLVLAAG